VTPVRPVVRQTSELTIRTLAWRFEEVLRLGDGTEAETVVDDALAGGLAPEAVQSLVIAPAMVRIGELWESRQLGVADEHLATSISAHAMIHLFAKMSVRRTRDRSRETILLAAVEGQHHVLGLRMVADVLESAGYVVFYLGADVPVPSLRDFARLHRPAVVGLTVGIAADVSRVADSIGALNEVSGDIRIMLGGRSVPKSLKAAYRYVPSSMEVVAAVEQLISGPPQRLAPAVLTLSSGGGLAPQRLDPAGRTGSVAERMAKAGELSIELARTHFRRSEAYRELAFRDPLTDLANRRAFEDELASVTSRQDATAAVLMIDVDEFKAVNDERGHHEGDQLLRAIAHAISTTVRPGDIAARVGGDEFAVLLPETTVSEACVIGERIRAAVADSAVLPVSLSVGVAPLTGDSRSALLAADTALYKAKASGRDRVVAAADLTVP
jgi:diguanylate cyclase (GGDEF)-like protein